MIPPTRNRADILSQLYKKLTNESQKTSYQAPTKLASTKPRLFALIIGINFYDNASSLRGAVADARAFKDYLESYLDVPDDQIQILLNKSASRSAILAGFYHLRDDPRIEKGDPIFVFYAGHGSETLSESGEDTIQVLVPQDYSKDPGRFVPPIPDRTIGALLTQIADVKGNNITVVFDCCHSASGTRGQAASSLVRSVELELPPIMGNVDNDITTGIRSLQVTTGFQHAGLNSHVLIAACSSLEKARENQGRGSFSSALLKLLRTVSPNALRYSDILSRMDQIPGQNPQCEGIHTNRYLFDSKVVAKDRLSFSVSLLEGIFVLGAGAVHGITKGAEFAVYAAADLALHDCLGDLIVEELEPFSAVMKPMSPIDLSPITSAVAVQTKAGEREDVRFYCPNDEDYFVCYEAFLFVTEETKDKSWNIVLVDNPEDAHMEISIEDEKVFFRFKDRTVTQYGHTRLFYDVTPAVEEIVPVIKAAAHYFWALNRTNHNPSITSEIQIEVYKMEASYTASDEIGQPLNLPVEPNLCRDNVVDFVVDHWDTPYCMKLTNNSVYDFYPNIFYFDNSDLSIGPYYQSLSAGGNYTLDVPLKKNGGTLTIGYGSGGSAPFSYYLRENQNYDVGFLKLFLSSQPIDLTMIPQSTPFDGRRGGLEEAVKPIVNDMWGTILVPVVQRRYPATSPNMSACSQCGLVATSVLDVETLQIQIEDLKYELELHRKTASQDIQKLEGEKEDLLARLQQAKVDLLDLPGPFDSGINQGSKADAERDVSNPAFLPPQNRRGAPRTNLHPVRMSLLERIKRVLRLWI